MLKISINLLLFFTFVYRHQQLKSIQKLKKTMLEEYKNWVGGPYYYLLRIMAQ